VTRATPLQCATEHAALAWREQHGYPPTVAELAAAMRVHRGTLYHRLTYWSRRDLVRVRAYDKEDGGSFPATRLADVRASLRAIGWERKRP